MKPYIGICDVASGAQAQQFLDYFAADFGLNGRQLMIGVMMSKKSLTGVYTKWADVWPKKEDLASIFIDHHRAYNCLHYADYEGPNIDDPDSLCRAIEYGGENLDAVQLDMIWPHPDMLYEVKQRFPSIDIILQIGGKAMDMLANDPMRISDLEGYNCHGCLPKFVLLDGSMGTGTPLNTEKLLPLLMRLAHNYPELGLAVAGGIGPRSVESVASLLSYFPKLSMDAQSKLRPSGSAMDPLDDVYVETFFDRISRKVRHLQFL